MSDQQSSEAEEAASLQDQANLSGESSAEEKDYFKKHPVTAKTPDFAAIQDVNERKKAFFSFLKPFVDEKNTQILQQRKRLFSLLTMLKKGDSLSAKDKAWLSDLRSSSGLDKVDNPKASDIKDLLNYIDIVPSSLVLAQAANESAWGTSRFATDGNNYFGQWCFRKGCGLVPESRDDGAAHEVRKFNDARESVFAYIDNLNQNAAYKKLRAIRANLRKDHDPITGLALVHGLDNYSQRGQAYVDEIEGLIQYNKLWRFNTQNTPKVSVN
ncbi:glucosaminidase domain-containing protein [Marinomonas spartinae]|nr:glucosaminidase domain-containing protein [Marinomonas spartinae]